MCPGVREVMASRTRSELSTWLVLSFATLLSLGSNERHAKTNHPQSTSEDLAVLEVIKEWEGMVPYWGKWLHFRLYQSGRVEYEKLTESEDSHQLRPIKHEMQLSSKDREEMIQLIEAQDFLNAREFYKELWSGVDAVYKTSIASKNLKQNKEIMLVNFIADDPKGKGYYPNSIISLMKKIEQVLKAEK